MKPLSLIVNSVEIFGSKQQLLVFVCVCTTIIAAVTGVIYDNAGPWTGQKAVNGNGSHEMCEYPVINIIDSKASISDISNRLTVTAL